MKRAKGNGKTPEKCKKSKADESTLRHSSLVHQLLSQAGVLIQSNGPVELEKDGAIVRRNLEQILRRHPDYPQIISDFVEDLSSILEAADVLKNFLRPSVTSSDDNISHAGSGDSLLRLLLSVDSIQPRLICLLLEKLVDPSLNEQAGCQGESLSRLIINQLRWLDKIVNPKETVSKLFEVISVADIEVQRDLVLCLPEVVEDSQHSEVARQLRDLVLENQSLHIAILDALTNLNLNHELLADVRESIIRILPSTETEGLPVIMQFLLRTCDNSDVLQVVAEIRSNLDISSLTPVASTPRKSRSDFSRSVISLVLDAVRSAIRFQKFIADAWIKAMELSTESLVALDILVIFVLHSCGYKKQSEGLVRSKITAGQLTEALLQSTFTLHAQALTEYFSSVLSVAEYLLRVHQPFVSSFASVIYNQAFISSNSHCKQEIVGNLVTHIGCGVHTEISLALDILLQLVTSHTQQMAPYAIFIKGVLDYLDNLNLSEIRKLYQMLACLACSSKQRDSILQDALHIIIRKQLSNSMICYQQMGVIGAAAVVFSIAARQEATDDSLFPASSGNSDTSLSDDAYQQSLQLLQLVRSSSNRSPEASVLFMEELARAIKRGTVHSRIEDWIAENVINDFQEAFVVDITENENDLKGNGPVVPWSVQYGLDNLSEGAIAINVLPLIAAARQHAHQHTTEGASKSSGTRLESIWCIAANFRLLQICESRQHDGDLESIDALLGCPLKLPEFIVEGLTDKLGCLSSKERHFLCDCLFVAINWFREIVNAFADQKDVEMRCKVISRLHVVRRLQELLPACLTDLSDYVPPPASNVEISDPKPIVIASTAKKSSGSKKKSSKKLNKKKKKKSTEAEDSDKQSDDESDNEDGDDKENKNVDEDDVESNQSSSTAIKCTASTRALRPYLREFDFEVFTILKIPLEVRFDKAPELGIKDAKKLSIQPGHLHLLLEDLFIKLDHILLADSSVKNNPFKKASSDSADGLRSLMDMGAATVARRMVALVPAICQHIEAVSAYYQALKAVSGNDDDDLDDSLTRTSSSHNSLMSDCFQLLLQVLVKLFSWHGFKQTENKQLFTKALAGIASRLSTGSLSQVTRADLVAQAFRYVQQLHTSIPRLYVAVTQCNLLSCLASIVDSEVCQNETKEITVGYLKKEWKDEDGQNEKGSIHNELLQKLLVLCFSHSDEPLSTIHDIASQGVSELLDNGQMSTSYATLTKLTYPVFYKSMLSELITYVKLLQPVDKSMSKDEERGSKLKSWSKAIKAFQLLVGLVKTFDARVNLGAVLKYGRQFLDQFLRICMPLVDATFRSHKEEIIAMLKNLQMSTRLLHHICGHSKIVKDVSLTNQVPQMKRCLEVFVYRVKVMLTVNNCLEAFWLGNLKNRDLKGDEIVSQVPRDEPVQQSDGEEGGSESEEGEEDDNSEEEEDEEERSNSPIPKGIRRKRPPKRSKAAIAAAERAQAQEDEEVEDDERSRDGRLSYSETY